MMKPKVLELLCNAKLSYPMYIHFIRETNPIGCDVVFTPMLSNAVFQTCLHIKVTLHINC